MNKTDKSELFENYPIGKAVASLCIPTVLTSLVSVAYSLADTYFVGMLNDPVQTAAVTLAAPVILAFNAFNNLFGVGSSSMMSRALGRKDIDTVHKSSSFGFYGALICAVLFSLVCTLFRTPLLGLLGADELTGDPTGAYLDWTVTLGAVPSILHVVVAYMIRAEGASLHASIGTMSGCLLNIALDPIFILPWGLGMGAEGAALATFISNCVSMLYFFGYIFFCRKTTCVCISPKKFTLSKDIVGGVFAVGVPSSVQNILNVTGSTILNNFTSPFGAAALSAMGICHKINMIPMFIAMGMSQGVMPLISYNYAAKNPKRMKGAISVAAKFTVIFLSAMAVVLFVFPRFTFEMFMSDAETVRFGERFMRVMSLNLPFFGLDFMAVGVFQAVGKGGKAFILAILRKIVFEIPLLFLLNYTAGVFGLPWAQTIAEFMMAVIGMIMLISFLKKYEKSQPQTQ